ncbi:hypothetical protein [Tissierella sp. Yu-01]|uniref:hypothetical protein n=1 Tax=Tissierella sp. Yu-01 TaxID=3035694 RepID=UPI00240DBEC1|nr:hypothetical protein [Tissierella sp. Yu-01]WFA09058.1 hypothetical protein P3962_00380 [Tissierella sp. Yu-01]
MFKKEKLNDILINICTAILIIAIVMIILDYFQIIEDNYSFTIIQFLVGVSLFHNGVLNYSKKKAWSIFFILLSVTSFLVLILGLF